MTETLLTILASVIALGGTFLALVKSGHIRIGKENGISAKLDKIESNDLHTISETLLRIEKKLEEVHENTIIIKTKQNNK